GVEHEAVDRPYAQPLAAAHRTARARAPSLAVHSHPALGFEIVHRLADRAEHLFAPADDRSPAAAHHDANEDDEDHAARDRDAADEAIRYLEARQVGLDQEHRA